MADVELLANGKKFRGWTSVDIDVGIESLAGSFKFSVSAESPEGDSASSLVRGMPCSVQMDGVPVITGFIDGISIQHNAREHLITVSGRDAAADLVDCSAVARPGEWLDRGMLDILKDLLKDFKIPVKTSTDLGGPISKFAYNAGETVFAVIDRLARMRAVLVISDGLGGIVLTQPGAEVIGTALIYGQNILEGTLESSNVQRFSKYRVLGSRAFDDDSLDESATRVIGIAEDRGVSRYRPSITVYEDGNATTESLTQRANWQRAVCAGRSERVTITVQDWKHAAGLWRPNVLVAVTNPKLRLKNKKLLISSVNYKRDMQGTRTVLGLAPRDAFLVDKLPEELLQ